MSTFKTTIFGVFLLFTLASGTKCPQEDVAKLVVCYYKSETSLSNFNVCSCTHVVFTNAVKKGENSSLNFNEGIARNLDLIKKKKDDILALFTLELKSDDASVVLKSGNRSNELINGVAALLKESKFNGVELNFKFSSEDGVSKESYVSFVKKLSKTLSSAHVRVKREGYDVFEKVQDDVTTAAYTTQTPKNSTSRTQSISIRNETKKSRNTREDKDYLDQTDKVPLEEDRSKEFPSEKPTESDANIDVESESEESKFLIFLRLSIEPEIIVKKFDLKLLGRYVDALLVPTHNIVSKNEDHLTYHPSRLMGLSDMLNTDSVVDFLVGVGAPKSKIVIIMPVTVLKFQLKDDTKNTPRSPTASKAQVVDQSQLCSLLSKSKNWTIERDDDLTAPYAYSGKTWLAFEDETSIGIKGKYILLRELAGGAVYPIDADTNDGSCPNRTRSGFLVQTLYRNFQNLGRKPRALVLENLQEEIHSTGFAGIEAGVKQSEYRIVRVVDHSGTVHVIRRNTKTQFECSRQGYFSHPLGCNKFYRCVKFDQYSDEFTVFEYDCPAGLAFDERWEVCVWPGSLPHGAPCTGSSEIAPVPRSHYRCPNQEGYYADLENCRWFFACLDHARDGVTPLTAYEFRCPFGLVFNEDRLACDWPWLVGACGNRGAASFLKTQTTFINGGNLAASSGQFGSVKQETTFHGFGGGFESGLKSGRGQSAGFGYIASGIDDTQNRASFGSFPDYEISGGRIFNKEGVILQQHIGGLDSSSGKPDGSLHAEKEGLNVIPGSAGAAYKQSGILYHRNSQSSYGRGSISVSTPTVNIPTQNKFTEHPTVVGNNLLTEFGQTESYRGDASFQDAVTTPKPFPAYIPSVQINQEQAYTGHPTAAGNTLLSAEFGQKQSIRDFDKVSVLTATAKPLASVNVVPSGGSVASSTAFSATPTAPTFKAAQISTVLKSEGLSFGNEAVGKVSSITFKPEKHNFEYSSVHGLHDAVGIQGVQLEQSFDTRPGVSISAPFSLSTTPTSSSSKTIGHNFRYSSEHTSGIPVTIGAKKPSVLGIATSTPEVHSFEQISAGAVQVQDFGQGVHFGTPQSTFKSVTNGVSGKLQTAPITDEYSFANGNIQGFSHPITPKPVQSTLSVQQVAFGQSGVSRSTPISFITTPKTPDFKPVEVSLSQPAITGRPFEHPSGDVNFSGSITSIPGVHTFEYSSNSDKETSAYGHGVFGQKFDIQSKVPVSTVRPPSSVNIVGSQGVAHSTEGYSDSIGISGSTASRSGLYTLEHISSYPTYGQSLGRKSFVGTASSTRSNENLRPVADSGRYSFQQINHVETLNTLQPDLKSPGFTSVLGEQNTHDEGSSQSVGLQQGTPTKPALFSSTLRPPAFKINKQSTPSAAIEYPSHKLTSVRVISSDPVISSGIQPVDVFEQTQLQSGKKDQPVSFVFTPESPNFKPVGISLSQNRSQIINTESTAANPHFFEFTSGQGHQSVGGEQNVGFGQRPTTQPISFSTSAPFGTTPKPQNFKSLKVSVSQPVSGYSDLHIIPESGVRNIESSQNFNVQDVKVSQQFTPTGEVYPYESELGVSGQKSGFKTTGSSNGKQGVVNVLSTQFVTPGVHIYKNTGSSFYSYQQSQNQPNNLQHNVDAKVTNEINLNEGLTYGIPIKNSESGLFDGKFSAERTSTASPIGDTLADNSPTRIPLGQQFSYSSFNRDGFASSRKIGATSNQQEILTELSIEQQPIVSIGTFQRSSTSKPNILSQGVNHVNVHSKTDINFQQQPFGENVQSLTPPATLQPELVSVTKSKTYSPSVTLKTDISKPHAEVVPFASLGRDQLQEKFPFSGSNEFKAREELTGLEITKSIELNPHQFYQSTPRPIVVQQEPVHLLPQKTYSFGVIQPVGKVQSEHQASVSSTLLPAGYSTVKTTLNNEYVGLTNGDGGVTPGLFKPNLQLKNGSPFTSQTGQLSISQEEGAFVQTQKNFDFQKIKSAEKISLQPQTVFRSQNATKFSINPNIEIPEPPKEYLAQYTTQSSTPSARGKFKSSTYFPPGNDNIEQIQNTGSFGQVIKERGSTYGYKSGGTTQKPRFRGRQYHGSLTANQKATNKYEEYDINGLGRSDSKTTIDLTNLKVDKDKKTVIIVSQVSDANPILVGKLAGQCSCQSNVIELKSKGKKSSGRKHPQITNEFLPPIETDFQRDASTPETVIIEGKAATTPRPDSSTILSSLSPDGVLTITPKSVYAGSLKKKQFRGRSRYLQPSEDLLSAVPASEIASTVDYAGARNEIDGAGAGAAFDRYGPGGWRSFDETLQGSVDCKRPGLFRHPKYCNKFYSCNYDPWKERYMLHVFNCPIHLAYDSSISACNWPVRGPACADDNLLV